MGLHFKNGDVAYLTAYLGGDERIRTAGAAFAEPCLTTWRRRREGERETGIEPATFSLARRCSTTEPLPHMRNFVPHFDCAIKIPQLGSFVNKLFKEIRAVEFTRNTSFSYQQAVHCFSYRAVNAIL